MKTLLIAVGLATLGAGPALADGPVTIRTPQLVLPEPETTTTLLPHSTVIETEPLALPEPETEAIAPAHRCREIPTT